MNPDDPNEGGYYVVPTLEGLPPFCRHVPSADDPALWIDAWAVNPSGDHVEDYRMGRAYADIAVAYARIEQCPTWVGIILATIHHKTMHGLIQHTSLEYGFFERISQLAYVASHN